MLRLEPICWHGHLVPGNLVVEAVDKGLLPSGQISLSSSSELKGEFACALLLKEGEEVDDKY